MAIPLNLVINPLSFGQVSLGILRELYKRNEDVRLTLTANQFDLSSEEQDEGFELWLKKSINDFTSEHSRDDKIFKLWHLNGALESFSKEQVLLSFYELDEPTREEINAVKNNTKVLFSNNETIKLFKGLGCENVGHLPLAYDNHNFHETPVDYNDDRVVFTLLGKFEKRKNHAKVIKSWLKRFGNDKKYALHCALWNPFFSAEQNNQSIADILDGNKYFNVVFSGFMKKNKQYNEFLNSAHVVLGMSGGEGWGLPEFHSVGLGKHAVILDCSGYLEWANDSNSVLVPPSGKTPIYDDLFFLKGAPWNQGQCYTFNEHAFIASCEEAIKRVEKNRVNEEGKKLKEKFTYSNMVDSIIKELN